MPKVTLPHANGFYVDDSRPVSAQECTNWYVSIPQAPALSEKILLGTPGYTQLVTTGTVQQINRESHVMNSLPYFVNGTTLYRIDLTTVEVEGVVTETFTSTALGTIPGEGRVSMADNGIQLMILVPGGDGFIWVETTSTFSTITDSDFKANGNPQHVVFNNARFVVTTDTKKFIVSAVNDGTDWNALDFGSAEADPDDIVAPVVHKNQLFITGSETTEVFQLIVTADFPYQRVPGFVMDKGLFAPFSAINANNTWMMVGGGTNESPAIWAFEGSGFTKISTTPIDSILQDLTEDEVSDIFSYQYAQRGAYFVAFVLPKTTLVIDTITGAWGERKSQLANAKGVTETLRQRTNSLVTAHGRILVGDSVDGRIGHMDLETFTEYGGNIVRTTVTQPFAEKGNSIRVSSLEPTFEAGVGTAAVPNPIIRVARSRNGQIFNDELLLPIGKVGEYDRRTIRRRWGRVGRFESFKTILSDAVKPVYIKLEANLRVGTR